MVQFSAAFSVEERCVTTLITAVKQTNSMSTRCNIDSFDRLYVVSVEERGTIPGVKYSS